MLVSEQMAWGKLGCGGKLFFLPTYGNQIVLEVFCVITITVVDAFISWQVQVKYNLYRIHHDANMLKARKICYSRLYCSLWHNLYTLYFNLSVCKNSEMVLFKSNWLLKDNSFNKTMFTLYFHRKLYLKYILWKYVARNRIFI